MNEESIDERNDVRPPYLYWDMNHKLVEVSVTDQEFWTERIEALLQKHAKPQITIWKGVV